MSQARIVELLENVITKGWTAQKITAGGAETVTVVEGAGKLGRLLVLDAVAVTPYDDTTAIWDAVNDADFDTSSTPVNFATSLKLVFGGAGSAWVIYRLDV